MSTMRACPPPPAAEPRARGHVLLVEDDDAIRQAYGTILRRANLAVEEARDGHDAIRKLAGADFDVVISDVRLPDTTGLDLLRTIRSIDHDMPGVLMSARADLSSALEAVEVGAIHYLLKPVERSVLCSAVEDGLRQRASAKLQREAFDLYSRSANERAQIRDMEVQFGRAIESLEMAYQPIVRLSTREVLAYEALVRPRDPQLTSPQLLFRAAEMTHRLHDVGRVIRRAVTHRLDACENAQDLFVNLHPHDLFDDSLFDSTAPLSRHARHVTLEITECASLRCIVGLTRRIEALRALGFRIAIDDLGAGYADLTAFAEVRPDVVKLDMSFTRGIETDTTKQRLVRAVHDLCDDVGTTFITEGIETLSELETLASLGCEVFQGWLFARPEPNFAVVPWDRIPAFRASDTARIGDVCGIAHVSGSARCWPRP